MCSTRRLLGTAFTNAAHCNCCRLRSLPLCCACYWKSEPKKTRHTMNVGSDHCMMNLCTGTIESTKSEPKGSGVVKTKGKRKILHGFFWHHLCLDTLVLARCSYHGCGNARTHGHGFGIFFSVRCLPRPVRILAYQTTCGDLWICNLLNSSFLDIPC